MTDLTIFQDYDRFIIAPRAQTSLSMTTGVADAYSLTEAKKMLAEFRAKSEAEIKAALRTFWTDGRFEAACAAGKFGAEW
jgi:hypothetical protein